MRLIANVFGLLLCFGIATAQAATTVPFGGNAYITKTAPAAEELIDDTGLHNWTSSKAVISTYVYIQQPGTLQLSLAGSLDGASHSRAKVTTGGQSKTVDLYSTGSSPFPVGSYYIARPGYLKIDLQGISTDGGYYGDISGLQIDGPAAAGAVFANDVANFLWSRRGPSAHLNFNTPADTEYFYSEITVASGQDPIGTYYMANGFDGGYFGIQVKSPTTRWVLFSVWDSSAGNATLVRKGSGVVIDDFEGEGTGGQSYLVFPWKTGKTYRFLTRTQPDGKGNVLYSAWFGLPTEQCGTAANGGWKFIATWKYAGAATNQAWNSFIEGFDPDTGYLGRRAAYGNQWAISTSRAWTEITRATFNVDPTGHNRQRLDYAGGIDGKTFYLRNDGFFSGAVTPKQAFVRPPATSHPNVNFNQLP
ncbi:MAG: DUF5077 domain-containing protein [Pseudoxanthomonas sp.]